MISPRSGVLHEKGKATDLCRSNFGLPPATTPIKIEFLRKCGPRRLLGLAQRPAAGALLPRATRSKGGEGRAQKFPGIKRERKRMLSARPQWSATGAVPEQSLLSQMAAVARLGYLCQGVPGLPGSVWGKVALRRRRRFLSSNEGKLSAVELCWRHLLAMLGSPRVELDFGVSFWGCWVFVRGSFYP